MEVKKNMSNTLKKSMEYIKSLDGDIHLDIRGRKINAISFTSKKLNMIFENEEDKFIFKSVKGKDFILKKKWWEKNISLSDIITKDPRYEVVYRIASDERPYVQTDDKMFFYHNVYEELHLGEYDEEDNHEADRVYDLLRNEASIDDIKTALWKDLDYTDDDLDELTKDVAKEFVDYLAVIELAKKKAIEQGYVESFVNYDSWATRVELTNKDLYKLYEVINYIEHDKKIDLYVLYTKKEYHTFEITYKADDVTKQHVISLVGDFPYLESLKVGNGHLELRDKPLQFDYDTYNK